MKHYQNIPLVLEECQVLKKLEELAKTPIFHVTGTNFFEGFVAEKGHVVKLGIVRIPLKRFPEIIFQLPYLRTLLLEHTTLKKIPKGIGTLVHLEKLSFSCNEIVNLPEELGNCRNINYLDISHNKLREIPKTLINLNKLSFLVIEDNAINVSQSFETILVFKRQKCEIERDNAFNWTNVKLLRSLINSGMDQSQLYDKIFEIENSLGFKDRCERMFAYEHKDLRKEGEIITKKWEARSDEYEAAQKPAGSDNQEDDDYSWALFYQDIPLIKDEYDVLVYLEKFLKTPVPKVNSVFANFGFKAKDGHIIALGLYALNLDSLPEGLVLCQQLEEFNLGKNKLQELPPWVQYLEHLSLLNLEKNQLRNLPDWLGELQNLESLDVSDNLLSELPESLAFISGLKSLNIQNNFLEVNQTQPILEFCKVHGCEILTNHAFNLE